MLSGAQRRHFLVACEIYFPDVMSASESEIRAERAGFSKPRGMSMIQSDTCKP